MPAPFIPTRDSLLLAFALNFATRLTANPALYGLTAGDASAVAAAQVLYAADYATATTDSTRTKVTVAAKDTSRGQLVILLRSYAAIIQSNLGVSQSDKTDLGLTIRDLHPSRISAPTSAPTLAVLAAQANNLTMTYHDPNQSAHVKAKPAGATALELYAASSATVVSDPTTLPFRGLITKTPFVLPTLSADAGKTIYYAGRWVTRRGLVGPFSAIGTTIAV